MQIFNQSRPDLESDDYLIHQLADKAGVSVRTIRYYISEGLLPAPDAKGRYATYSDDYLRRLELIMKLKEAFLPLKEIRDRIAGLDPGQIEEMLHQLEMGEGNKNLPIPPSTPLNFKVLNDRPLDDALEYLSNVMGSQQISSPEVRSQPALPTQPNRPQKRQTGEIETWQRIILAPGVELNVRSSEEPFFRERIRQIVEFARIQFS